MHLSKIHAVRSNNILIDYNEFFVFILLGAIAIASKLTKGQMIDNLYHHEVIQRFGTAIYIWSIPLTKAQGGPTHTFLFSNTSM